MATGREAIEALRRTNLARPIRQFLLEELSDARTENETLPVTEASQARVQATKRVLALLFGE